MKPREQLLKAATIHFASKGFFEATIRDICDEAAMNIASVNYHFGSKRDLYKEVVAESYNRAGSFAPMPTIEMFSGNPKKALVEWVHWYIKRLMTSDANTFSKLLAHEMSRPSGVLNEVVPSNIQPLWDALIKILTALSPKDSDRLRTLRGQTILGSCLVHRMGKQVLGKLKTKNPPGENDCDEIATHIASTIISSIEANKLER
tara:strand:- start:1607 stop:2218 length:612 start_codon:yes stop_codon:yes gene_type:complete